MKRLAPRNANFSGSSCGELGAILKQKILTILKVLLRFFILKSLQFLAIRTTKVRISRYDGYIFLFLLFLPVTLWSLPCPNGNGILYKGDSIDEVVRQCGEPVSRNTNIRILYTFQDWTYYIAHRYDAGFSEVIVSFKNDVVSNIRVNDQYSVPVCRRTYFQFGQAVTVQTNCNSTYNIGTTALCGIVFGVGDSTARVAAICGLPAARTELGRYTFEVTELDYAGDDPQTIVFENGKLTDWRQK